MQYMESYAIGQNTDVGYNYVCLLYVRRSSNMWNLVGGRMLAVSRIVFDVVKYLISQNLFNRLRLNYSEM